MRQSFAVSTLTLGPSTAVVARGLERWRTVTSRPKDSLVWLYAKVLKEQDEDED